MRPHVKAFFNQPSNTVTYVVKEENGVHCLIIDSVLDYDFKSGMVSTSSADELIGFVSKHGLTVDWIFETHPHADHLSAAPYIKKALGGTIAIGKNIRRVQKTFKQWFNLGDDFIDDGSQFDHLFEDGETFRFGRSAGVVMFTPGHTPACVTYLIGDAMFVGDTIFMPDSGSARCDFPDGDARKLYRSVKRILSLPIQNRLFVCHDYAPGNRPLRWKSTVREQRAKNIHLNDTVAEKVFVKMRNQRDMTLEMPLLMLTAMQVNIRAGHLPPKEGNDVSYFKIPISGTKALE